MIEHGRLLQFFYETQGSAVLENARKPLLYHPEEQEVITLHINCLNIDYLVAATELIDFLYIW